MEKNLKKIVFLLVFLQAFAGYGQNALKKYYKYTNKAELAICAENYAQASRFYKKAFARHEPFGRDLKWAYLIHSKYIPDMDAALWCLHRYAQRGYEMPPGEWVEDSVKNALLCRHILNIRDTVKITVIPELRDDLGEIMRRDQAVRQRCRTYQDTCVEKVMQADFENLEKIEKLYRRYGAITQKNAGSLTPIYTSLLHNSQWKNDPKQLLWKEIFAGNFDSRAYAVLSDRFIAEHLHSAPVNLSYYATNAVHALIIHNTLFIYEPENIKQINKNRREILIAETWEDYLTKLLFVFYRKNPDFYFVPLQEFVFGDEEENKKEEAAWRADIDEKRVNGKYYVRHKSQDQ